MAEALKFPVATPPASGRAEPIAPGVRWLRMPLPFALDHINLWLLEDGEGWAAVDCGYAMPETKGAWERIFDEDLEGRPITRIFVTHYHPDHMGLADWLGRRWNAPLWTTEKEWLHARMLTGGVNEDFAPLRRDFGHRAGLDPEAGAIFAERHDGYRRGVPSVPPSYHRLTDGMTVAIGGRMWRVIVGEGHAPELACLYCAEIGVLIAGDQILPRISPNISVQAHEPEGDPLARYLASLAKLRRMVPAATFVLPSHNLPFYGLHARIDELAAHHQERCAEVLQACAAPKTAAEMVPVMFRRKLDGHQMAFALGEALAHLHFLVGTGELRRRREPDGVDRFLRA
ncbi:MAG: MBL fold metallo-hydrolase [Alphaproteobacteria bacterium]|nr:MBL fold metallo-hydrolase [Alphaproteobacteria bacterium]